MWKVIGWVAVILAGIAAFISFVALATYMHPNHATTTPQQAIDTRDDSNFWMWMYLLAPRGGSYGQGGYYTQGGYADRLYREEQTSGTWGSSYSQGSYYTQGSYWSDWGSDDSGDWGSDWGSSDSGSWGSDWSSDYDSGSWGSDWGSSDSGSWGE